MATIGFVVALAFAIALGTLLSYGIAWAIIFKTDMLEKLFKKSIDLGKKMTDEIIGSIDIRTTEDKDEA